MTIKVKVESVFKNIRDQFKARVRAESLRVVIDMLTLLYMNLFNKTIEAS